MLYYKKQSENTFQKNCFKLKKLFLQLIQNQIKLTLTTNLFFGFYPAMNVDISILEKAHTGM